MAQDPWLEELKRRKQQQTDPWLEELNRRKAGQPIDFGEEEARSVERVSLSPSAVRDVTRAALQGLPFVGTFADEAEAALTGRPYGQISQEMGKFRSENPAAAYGTELATGIASGGLATNLAKRAGSKAVQAALQSPMVQGAFSGFGAAEGDIGSRVTGAGIGASIGGILGKILTPKTRVPGRDVARDAAAITGGMGQSARIAGAESMRNRVAQYAQGKMRTASDALATRAPRLAALIEPTDAVKVQRQAQQAFPGQASIDLFERQAQQAAGATQALEESLKAAEAAVKESTARTASRAAQLTTRAEQTAVNTTRQIEQRAAQRFAELGRGSDRAAVLRETVQEEMEALGKELYPVIREIGPVPKPPIRLYQQIESNPSLKSAFDFALSSKNARVMKERVGQAMEAGQPISQAVEPPRIEQVVVGQYADPKTGKLIDITRPAIDVETFDYMKRWVSDRVEAKMAGDPSGLSRSQAKAIRDQIGRMEEDLLNAYPPDARAKLMAARKPQAERFRQLELIQDGFNLTRFTLDAPAEMRQAAQRDLTELINEVSALTPEQRKFFEVPAKQAIANLIQSSDQSLGSVANALVGTTQASRRTALALGQETTEQLKQFLPSRIQEAAERTKAPIQTTAQRLQERATQGGGRRTGALQGEATRLAQELTGQQARQSQAEALTSAARRFSASLPETSAGREAAEGFLDVRMPALGNHGLAQIRQYGSAEIRRELQGMGPEEAQKRIQQLLDNPATRQLYGQELTALMQAIQPGPRVVRPALGRTAGSAASRLLTGMFTPSYSGYTYTEPPQ